MASPMRGLHASRLLDAVVAQTMATNSIARKIAPSATNLYLNNCLSYGVNRVGLSTHNFDSNQTPCKNISSYLSSPLPQKFLKRKGIVPARRPFSTSRLHMYLKHKTGTVEEENEATGEPSRETIDLTHMFRDIKKELRSEYDLEEIAKYYFDGQGKAVRPMVTVLMAQAINHHLHNEDRLYESQFQVAKIAEMIHTASLVHDDVIDESNTRRGKPSINELYGQRKAVLAGDYILSVASAMLARIENEEVIVVLSQVLADLVEGEFMQLGSKENENERFAHYLTKTFKKTASLLAYSCKAVAILSGADEKLQEVAFQYGRNVGIAFQLVDDMLDYVSSSKDFGKPVTVDLKLGLATAPVLFACEKFPDLNPMIMRRFQEPGDRDKALEFVHKSDGIQQTKFLARQHCQEAIRVISSIKESNEQKALVSITDKVLHRMK